MLRGSRRLKSDFRLPIASVLAALRPFRRPEWFALDGKVRSLTLPYIAPSAVPSCDVVVATEVQTANLVSAASRQSGSRGFYFIQHYEDWSAEPTFIDATWTLDLKKIVIAPWLKRHVESLSQECELIPNGIDPDEFPAGGPTQDRPHTVCAMVSDVPWKRTDLVVKVLNDLVAKYPEFSAVTFGTCERPEGLAEQITHVTTPSRETISHLYQSSRIYLCASDGEGWHLPPAEAMSSGCAVVSTDIGGVRAYADGTALFSAVGDSQALLENVDTLLSDPALCQSVATRGLLRMREYTPEKAASNFEAALLRSR